MGWPPEYAAEKVDFPCAEALELDVVDVTKVARMLERAVPPLPVGEGRRAGPTAFDPEAFSARGAG